MKTAEYLFGPAGALFWPGVIAALAVAVQGALLSVFVVLKRMAFIGQGVSHAAFGGVGLAVLLNLAPAASFPLIAAFCIAAAWGIAWAGGASRSRRDAESSDTVIGVALVASMALGAILIAARQHAAGGTGGGGAPPWEQILFGSLLAVGRGDALMAWASAALVAGALAWFRRPLLLCAFDEPVAASMGAPARAMRVLLLTLLAIAVVSAMKLAGVVLATAALVLPGAIALKLSQRLATVLALSVACAVLGVLGGAAASFELDLPPGACIVAALTALYLLATAGRAITDAAPRRPDPSPGAAP